MPKNEGNSHEIHQSLEILDSIFVKSSLRQLILTLLLEIDLLNIILEYLSLEDVLKLKHIMMGHMPFKNFKLLELQMNLKKFEVNAFCGFMAHCDTFPVTNTVEGYKLSKKAAASDMKSVLKRFATYNGTQPVAISRRVW